MQDGQYDLLDIEFHHARFDTNESGNASSTFSILLHVANPGRTHRWAVTGNLLIDWSHDTDEEGLYLPRVIDATDLTIMERAGPKAFDSTLVIKKIREWNFPVAYDLDRDGLSEIVLPGQNKVLWNRGESQFETEALFTAPGSTCITTMGGAISQKSPGPPWTSRRASAWPIPSAITTRTAHSTSSSRACLPPRCAG